MSHTLNHRIILIGTDFHGQLLQYTFKSYSNIQLLRDTSQQALDVFTTSLAICCSSLLPSQRKDVCLPTQFSTCLIILVTLWVTLWGIHSKGTQSLVIETHFQVRLSGPYFPGFCPCDNSLHHYWRSLHYPCYKHSLHESVTADEDLQWNSLCGSTPTKSQTTLFQRKSLCLMPHEASNCRP